ncbi:G-protein coupled receptor GRL101-like isoform X1 [Montipora foliosa]|uniref:G-protein coupled receptor GRL101-like isoform X1 n=2 Tax=Montipora foliosa TaxID=591990 RepID=UPI0035F18DAD
MSKISSSPKDSTKGRDMASVKEFFGAVLLSIWISQTQPEKQSCPFVTENNKCCKLPFVYNNRRYDECVADVDDEEARDPDKHWRNPWCFAETHQGDRKVKFRCLRNGHSCGGSRTQTAGVISSSNFPHNYKSNVSCAWKIHVDSANHVTLNFTDFELENSTQCEHARVSVFDGLNTSDPTLGIFCGSHLPRGVRSSGNKMLVEFSAGRGDLFKGFRAYYDSGDCRVRSYGGNGGGACCVFPFTHNGKLYYDCVHEDDGHVSDLWCSVTSNYDRDKKRGFCVAEDVSCGNGKFECRNYHWWKQCIDKKHRCDGHAECADKSDEMGCPPMLNPYGCSVFYVLEVPNGNNVGVALNRKCNYENRCNNSRNHGPDKPCNFSDWFKCKNNLCVPNYWRCDGKDDCGDRSDEIDSCPFEFESSKEACSWINHCVKDGWEASLGNEKPVHVKSLAKCNEKNITRIPTYLPIKITVLMISKGKIARIERFDFARYGSLEKIDLEGNQIESIEPHSFSNQQQLKILILKSNKLRVLETGTFEGLTKLTELNLLGNPVQKIKAGAFYGLEKLGTLNLSSMELTSISSGAFRGMDSLRYLYLSNNKNLQQLPPDVFRSISLSYLEVDKFEFCCIAKLSEPKCSAPKDLFSSCNDLMANMTLRLSIWILGSIALLGNAFVLIWRLKTKSDNKVHALLLLNLAIADFLMGIYLVMIGSVDVFYRGKYFIYNDSWKHSPLCQFSGFVSTLSSEASVIILTIMTLDRYVTITHPFKHIGLSLRGAHVALVITWLTAFILAGVPLTGIHYFKEFYARSGVCLPLHLTAAKPVGWEYSVFVFLALNFVSFMLIFFLYLIMFFKIQNTRKMSAAGTAVSSIGSRMVFIVLTDFCCWIPIIIIGIASLLGMEAKPLVYAWIAVFVLPLNSALNPILYTISTANFRRKLRFSFLTQSRMTRASEHSYLDSRTVNSGPGHETRTIVLLLSNEESNFINGEIMESGV